MKHKNKNLLVILAISVFILCNSLFHSNIVALHEPMTNNKQYLMDNPSYQPHKITPQNVSYHPSTKNLTLEWWYFEGIFQDGYNAVVNIIVLSKNNIGVCITHLNIFHIERPNESFAKRIFTPLFFFQGSQEYPDISIHDKQIIDFDQDMYQALNQWKYHVSLEIDDSAVDLYFEGLSPGWEGETIGGMYGPVLPMANVHGTLTFRDNQLTVYGQGYHEHAHGITFPVKEWGWYWGKIVGENTSLFWGKMMNTRWNEQARAGVFSIKNDTFININPEHIEMTLSDYIFHSKRLIPTKFSFNVTDKTHDIYIQVQMETVHVYHLPIGFFNYWRYIIKINGTITYHGIKEELSNKTQIMELMRFR